MRRFLHFAILCLLTAPAISAPPNIVVIRADDLEEHQGNKAVRLGDWQSCSRCVAMTSG